MKKNKNKRCQRKRDFQYQTKKAPTMENIGTQASEEEKKNRKKQMQL